MGGKTTTKLIKIIFPCKQPGTTKKIASDWQKQITCDMDCCLTRIRTWTDRTKNCSATITP